MSWSTGGRRWAPRARRGFTLWELTMVLLIMSIAATLAVPAFARLGSEKPATAADAMLGLLHDARKASIDYNATTTLRLDPKTLKYEVDTSGGNGFGQLASGTLDLGMSSDAAGGSAAAAVHLPPDRRDVRGHGRCPRRSEAVDDPCGSMERSGACRFALGLRGAAAASRCSKRSLRSRSSG